MLEAVKVGVLGLGTVGSGAASILQRNADEIARRAGRGICISIACVRDLKKQRDCDIAGMTLTADPEKVVSDPDVKIVLELMGGTDDALKLVLMAIDHGKHVVTANKALIAFHGNEIFQRAQDKGVAVAFEAAVAGGIPIIKALREGLAANAILWLAGVINGTGNFILTEMCDKGRDFDEVLKEAQRLGYAEADPSFDIQGTDAAHKLTILASVAFGVPLQFEKVHTEGITGISGIDVAYASELGYRIKHLGIARRTDSGLELRVHPALIPCSKLIANVDGVMNAVIVKADALGQSLYYGPGAGAEPTGSAVVADLVDVVRALTTDPENRVPHLAFQPDSLSDIPVLSIDEVYTAYYLRIHVLDRPGVLADVTRIFAAHKISIEAIIQKEQDARAASVPIIILTHRVNEKNMKGAIAEIEELDVVTSRVTLIRLETLI